MHIDTFTHNGDEYEIRVIHDGEFFHVQVFRNNRPSSQYRYSVKIEDNQDMASVVGTDAVQHLIETAKQDFIRGWR